MHQELSPEPTVSMSQQAESQQPESITFFPDKPVEYRLARRRGAPYGEIVLQGRYSVGGGLEWRTIPTAEYRLVKDRNAKAPTMQALYDDGSGPEWRDIPTANRD